MESDSCPAKAKMQRPELCTEGQRGRGEWSAVKRCSASLNMTTGTDIPRCHSGTVTCADEQLEKVPQARTATMSDSGIGVEQGLER
ncbi:uncharacterized protein VSU04_011987 isoform 2-T7 [Chlamydotis macqueenii]